MRCFFVLIVIFTLFGCHNSTQHYPSLKVRLLREISGKIARQIANETGLIPCGTGSQAMDQIKMLALAFEYQQELDIDSGRKLLIKALEIFRSAINSDERIRPYLGNYPFEPNNIEIEIYIHKKNGATLGSDKLCIVDISQGILKYRIHFPDKWSLKTIHKESYEEALQKLDEAK